MKSVSQGKLFDFKVIFKFERTGSKVDFFCKEKSSCFMRGTAMKRIVFFVHFSMLYVVYFFGPRWPQKGSPQKLFANQGCHPKRAIFAKKHIPFISYVYNERLFDGLLCALNKIFVKKEKPCNTSKEGPFWYLLHPSQSIVQDQAILTPEPVNIRKNWV